MARKLSLVAVLATLVVLCHYGSCYHRRGSDRYQGVGGEYGGYKLQQSSSEDQYGQPGKKTDDSYGYMNQGSSEGEYGQSGRKQDGSSGYRNQQGSSESQNRLSGKKPDYGWASSDVSQGSQEYRKVTDNHMSAENQRRHSMQDNEDYNQPKEMKYHRTEQQQERKQTENPSYQSDEDYDLPIRMDSRPHDHYEQNSGSGRRVPNHMRMRSSKQQSAEKTSY